LRFEATCYGTVAGLIGLAYLVFEAPCLVGEDGDGAAIFAVVHIDLPMLDVMAAPHWKG
jgi:hypothetical protein